MHGTEDTHEMICGYTSEDGVKFMKGTHVGMVQDRSEKDVLCKVVPEKKAGLIAEEEPQFYLLVHHPREDGKKVWLPVAGEGWPGLKGICCGMGVIKVLDSFLRPKMLSPLPSKPSGTVSVSPVPAFNV